MCNEKDRWGVNLDNLDHKLFECLLEHAAKCDECEELLINYEEEFLPVLRTALPEQLTITAPAADLTCTCHLSQLVRLRLKLRGVLKNSKSILNRVISKASDYAGKIKSELIRGAAQIPQFASIILIIALAGLMVLGLIGTYNWLEDDEPQIIDTQTIRDMQSIAEKIAIVKPETPKVTVRNEGRFKNAVAKGKMYGTDEVIVPTDDKEGLNYSVLPGVKSVEMSQPREEEFIDPQQAAVGNPAPKTPSGETKAEDSKINVDLTGKKINSAQEQNNPEPTDKTSFTLTIKLVGIDAADIKQTQCSAMLVMGGNIVTNMDPIISEDGTCQLLLSPLKKYEVIVKNPKYKDRILPVTLSTNLTIPFPMKKKS
ncbi:MAG TPA: hypothetical protein VF721_12475 [Pyrinomonadaceae bacterium]